jgi:hypothetical protein
MKHWIFFGVPSSVSHAESFLSPAICSNGVLSWPPIILGYCAVWL